MRLLSVDWDYFVPSIDLALAPSNQGRQIPFALGSSEVFTDEMLDALWDCRAATLLAHGSTLPRTSGAEHGFWSRFRIDPTACLYFADSHAQAAHAAVRTGVTEVWNFDAHHDCGYEGTLDDPVRLGWVACANWMCAYALAGAALRVRYPSWREDALWREVSPVCPADRAIDDGGSLPLTFDVIFVARSSAWTPPWLDGRFEEFLRLAPVAQRVCLDGAWRIRRLDRSWIEHLRQLTRTRGSPGISHVPARL
jgi:hypothetical protein